MPRTRVLMEGEGVNVSRSQKERYGLIIRPCSQDVMDDFRRQSKMASAAHGVTQAQYLRAMLDLVVELREMANGSSEPAVAGGAIKALLQRHGLESV